jgi:hypothetical protein
MALSVDALAGLRETPGATHKNKYKTRESTVEQQLIEDVVPTEDHGPEAQDTEQDEDVLKETTAAPVIGTVVGARTVRWLLGRFRLFG